MNPFSIPAVPQSRRLDPMTGHPVNEIKPADILPPQLPSAQQMAMALRQGENERQRKDAEGQDEYQQAAAWVRGRSVTRCLIELTVRVMKLEKGR